jgi:hypothetical protein
MRIQGTRSPRNRRGLDIPGGHAVIRLVNYKATDKSLSPYLANGHVPHVVCHLKKVVGLLVDPKSESQIHISASVEDGQWFILTFGDRVNGLKCNEHWCVPYAMEYFREAAESVRQWLAGFPDSECATNQILVDTAARELWIPMYGPADLEHIANAGLTQSQLPRGDDA